MGAQAVRLSNVDIDNALKNKDLEVLFQPIFDLGNGALARMETFIRWRHPALGVLPPGAFISFFETQGRMGELTRYIINEALDEYSNWRGPYAPGFSINLAQSDLSDEAFASHFIKLLRDRDFPADLVTLECPMPPTETDLDVAMQQFDKLRKTGARLAIEVRGRANDLLKAIDPFPFDEIKTGGSAILRFARTVRGPGMTAISDLLEIANTANAAITAVGVEDQASLAALRGLGFTAAQGNHLGAVGGLKEFRPTRVNEVRKLLDLEPLDGDSLSALFRTRAPAPGADSPNNGPDATLEAKPSGAASDVAPMADAGEDIVERLNRRVARHEAAQASSKGGTAPKAGDLKPQEPGEQSPKVDDEKRQRAREKAKALALAKRAKAREARKMAAIQRAKERAALMDAAAEAAADQATSASTAAAMATTPELPPSSDPRVMQERLSAAFDQSAKKSAAGVAPQRNDAPIDGADDVGADDVGDDSVDIEFDAPDAPADAAPQDAVRDDEREQNDSALAPSTAAAAPVEGEPSAAPTAAAASPAHAAPMKPAPRPPMRRLSVKQSGASFQQVMRVANTVSNASFHRPEPEPSSTGNAATAANRPSAAEPAAAPMPSPDSGALRRARTDMTPEAVPVGDLDLDAGDSDAVSHAMPAQSTIRRQPRKRRKKNFLTRKYDLVPTHFWPRPWKRWYRRTFAARPAD